MAATMAHAQEGGGGTTTAVNPIWDNCVIAHGTIMGFVFAFLLPVGAIIIRVASFRGLVWIHAGIQAFAYILALVGLGLGVYIAVYPDSQVRCPIFYRSATSIAGADAIF